MPPPRVARPRAAGMPLREVTPLARKEPSMPRRLLLAALACLVLTPAAAQAADSQAPQGARGDWLPRSEWVMSSWLPFDEARLYSLLDTDRKTVAAWLDDHRTLGQFAARRGYRDQRELAEKLVAPRLHTASAAMRAHAAPALARHALPGAPRAPRPVSHLPHPRDPAPRRRDLRDEPAALPRAARQRHDAGEDRRPRRDDDRRVARRAAHDPRQARRPGRALGRDERPPGAGAVRRAGGRDRRLHAAPLPHAGGSRCAFVCRLRCIGRPSARPPSAVPQSPKMFSSERKMFTIETKMPVASQTASSAVPCLRR